MCFVLNLGSKMAIKKDIAIFGSTGSIGTQTLDVIRRNPESFNIKVLVANSSWELIVKQAREFTPELVVLSNAQAAEKAKIELAGICEVESGQESIINSVSRAEVIVAAMVGFEGMKPVLAAIEANKIVALANKETLVAGGSLVKKALKNSTAQLIPLD